MTRCTTRMGRPPIRSLGDLEKAQNQLDARLRQYLVSYKPEINVNMRKALELRAAHKLNAVNLKCRSQLGSTLHDALKSHFSRCETETAYFVTLASEEHAVNAIEGQAHDLAAHRNWIASILDGTSFVGMIEPGYYPKVSFMPPSNTDWISWHAHIVVWDVTVATLKELKCRVNRTERSFRPGASVFHFRKAHVRSIEAEVAYMCKSPRSEHYTYPRRRSIVHVRTGEKRFALTGIFKQNKREIRTGKLPIVLSALANKSILSLCVSGGVGTGIASMAMSSAKRALQKEKKARDKALQLL
jgi:hypothetical protein